MDALGLNRRGDGGKEYRQGVLHLSDFPNIEDFANTVF